ncbi:MAG: hypoxanthine phosphoribosyltransferase [Chitinophagaceae bacterium]|nr:MAG: hypoxanthine phosphoribosyltransferase [Chitinophagaceae bacterium]
MDKYILDKNFVPYLNEANITEAVSRIASSINVDYADKIPLFIAILNGSFIFAADLYKKINVPSEISFVKLSSYAGTQSSGSVTTTIGLDVAINARDIIIIEDIVDTGKTLTTFIAALKKEGPSSIRVCALLHKQEATTHPIPIDYLGFTIPNLFVVGYGLDYNGFGRNLKGIHQLKES